MEIQHGATLPWSLTALQTYTNRRPGKTSPSSCPAVGDSTVNAGRENTVYD